MTMTDSFQNWRTLTTECRAAVIEGIDLILSRSERDPGYPFLDTKLSTITGRDFDEPDDPACDFRGRSAVFGWIQGRGMEALAGHACFFRDQPERAARCDRLLERVAARMAEIGAAQGGRYAFLFTPDGRSFRRGPDGRREFYRVETVPPGYTDLFVGKGLAAAGLRLGRREWLEQGVATFRTAVAAIRDGAFVSDQISFDPGNPVHPAPVRLEQGPWMIGLGGFALMCGISSGAGQWVAEGCAFIRHLLRHHVIEREDGGLRRFDYTEWGDVAGGPWRDGQGRVLQDPGHAIEFTGLAARFLLHAAASGAGGPQRRELTDDCRERLPDIFLSAWSNGFQPRVGGICKTVDLVARRPVNDNMPWWSLPEAMRAGTLLRRLFPAHPRAAELEAAVEAGAQALFGAYRSPVPGLFLQMRNARGEPVAVVPATPDADAGYHTGLCLIDVLTAGRGEAA